MNNPLPVEWSEVECPQCRVKVAWLGDHGASITVHGKCLRCFLLADHPEPWTPELEEALDAEVEKVVALREERERTLGRRVFPCIHHNPVTCAYCGGRGWIIGYPPGVYPPS